MSTIQTADVGPIQSVRLLKSSVRSLPRLNWLFTYLSKLNGRLTYSRFRICGFSLQIHPITVSMFAKKQDRRYYVALVAQLLKRALRAADGLTDSRHYFEPPPVRAYLNYVPYLVGHTSTTSRNQ